MDINLHGIVVIVGNYGSGKTEVSINLAVERKRAGLSVRIADLDLVNPYFRTREARLALAEAGVEVVLPPEEYLQADLPLLSPSIAAMIRNPGDLSILDVGGEDAGATVLASLADAFKGKRVDMLQVINPCRPATSTSAGCTSVREKIEKACRMQVTGLIGNSNLIDETGIEEIESGYGFVLSHATESGLPLKFITVPRRLLEKIKDKEFVCPVLPIARQLVPPWKKAMAF
ncbi:MAG TPA: cobalamin biosynthesis protein CbiA [Desulfobacteraceae bacterium]|nr:MAG: cobalamin biosynthesis protein CbiA [Deltaproteobacteria bacterium]HDZ24108.1 cobalamin biosynthesis protein CbiA [Desulfobacteraceae bacterium]